MIRDYPYRLMWFYLFVGGIVSLYISEKKNFALVSKKTCYP